MLYDGLALPASGLPALDGGHVFPKKKKKNTHVWSGYGTMIVGTLQTHSFITMPKLTHISVQY